MTDLQATVDTARENLRKIWQAFNDAHAINLDYGPGAWTADGMPHHRNPPAEGSILHYRGQDVTKTDLSAAYDASVRQLAEALVPASELSWVDDGYAQGSVLPHNQSHIPLSQAQNINRLVTAALHATNLMLNIDPNPSATDTRYVNDICEHITGALICLPDDMTIDPVDRKLCIGVPGFLCNRAVPGSHKRCGACRAKKHRMTKHVKEAG